MAISFWCFLAKKQPNKKTPEHLPDFEDVLRAKWICRCFFSAKYSHRIPGRNGIFTYLYTWMVDFVWYSCPDSSHGSCGIPMGFLWLLKIRLRKAGVLVIAVILFGYQAFKRLSKIAQDRWFMRPPPKQMAAKSRPGNLGETSPNGPTALGVISPHGKKLVF